MNFSKNKSTGCFILLAFVALDLVFIGIYFFLFIKEEYTINHFLLLDTLHGLPELFQFFKYGSILVLIGNQISKGKRNYLIPLFLIFLLFFLDDYFQLHSMGAHFISNLLPFEANHGFQNMHWGNLLYNLLLGIVTTLLLFKGYLNSPDTMRIKYAKLMTLLVIFIFFGFGIDFMSHLLSCHVNELSLIVPFEEGGEMISLSLLVWYFFELP